MSDPTTPSEHSAQHPTDASGNRWEPGGAVATAPPPATPAAAPPAAGPVLPDRTALVAAGVAAAVVLVGAAGFGLGRVTADGHDGPFPGDRGQQLRPQPGAGFGGPGAAPGQIPGQLPGQLPDRDDQ